MSLSEGRQEAEGRPLLLPRCQREIQSSGLALSFSTGMSQPDGVGQDCGHCCSQPDAIGADGAFYAVYNATESTPTHLSRRARRNRSVDRGFAEEDVSDEMLLRNIAEGNKAAMHIVFARYRANVSCFILRMGINPTVAQDLVGQTFLDIWRTANRLEKRARVSTWLTWIARLKAPSCFESKETNDILRACIANLCPAHREMISLFYHCEKSIAEMSEIMGIPRAIVRSRLFYGRKQLARIVMSAGFEAAAAQTNMQRESRRGLLPAISYSGNREVQPGMHANR